LQNLLLGRELTDSRTGIYGEGGMIGDRKGRDGEQLGKVEPSQ